MRSRAKWLEGGGDNLRKSDMIKDYEVGGLKTIDFDMMNGVIQLKWLQSFINNESSFCFQIPTAVLKKCGGVSFLLQCDFELSKIIINEYYYTGH